MTTSQTRAQVRYDNATPAEAPPGIDYERVRRLVSEALTLLENSERLRDCVCADYLDRVLQRIGGGW